MEEHRLNSIQQARSNFSKVSNEIDVILIKFDELKEIAK